MLKKYLRNFVFFYPKTNNFLCSFFSSKKNWAAYLADKTDNMHKTPFMDISLNEKKITFNEFKNKIKNKELASPFSSPNEIDYQLVEVQEGNAKIIISRQSKEYDPESKFDFFSQYNMAQVFSP